MLKAVAFLGLALVLTGCRTEIGRGEVKVGYRGMTRSDSIALSGSYVLTWFAQADPTAPCGLDASISEDAPRSAAIPLVTTKVAAGQRLTGSSAVGPFSKGGYVITARSECEWRLTFTPN